MLTCAAALIRFCWVFARSLLQTSELTARVLCCRRVFDLRPVDKHEQTRLHPADFGNRSILC